MKDKGYPKVLQHLIYETEELLNLAKRTKKNNLTGKRLDIILTNRIGSVGTAVNTIIEDSSLDHALCYEVINDATYKIKDAINILPLDSLGSMNNVLSIYSLSMFLINNLIYFSDNDVEKLNTISLLLSELLITNSVVLGEREIFNEFKIPNKEKFTAYQRFCQSICTLIQNAFNSVPAISEKDLLLWSEIATSFSADYLSLIKNLSYEMIAEKNTFTNQYTKKAELVYLSLYINISALLNIVAVLQYIVELYYNKLNIHPNLTKFFSNNVDEHFNTIIAAIEKKIRKWLTKTEEDYKKGIIPIVDDPEKNMNFVISKLGHKFIVFLKTFNHCISKYFSEQKRGDPRILERYLTEIIQVGEDFLDSAENIFKSKVNIINSPYGGTYLAIFQRVISIHYLLTISKKSTDPIEHILDKYGIIFSSVPFGREPSLFVTKIILQITKYIEERNMIQLEQCLESIAAARKELDLTSFYEGLTLGLLDYLLQITLQKIDNSTLKKELQTLKEQHISSYLPHLEQKYDTITKVLLAEEREDLVLESNLIPYDQNSWFFPPFNELDTIKEQYQTIDFKAFNFLAKFNKVVEK